MQAMTLSTVALLVLVFGVALRAAGEPGADRTAGGGGGGGGAAGGTGGYVKVNGINMYYEVHGEGRGDARPLVVIHGAFGWAMDYPALSRGRRVIAVELQGHGHTADVADRPLTCEGMADDVAALLKALKVERADFFGYSLGGNVALAVAIRHPDVVGKVAINGSNAGPIERAYEPETFEQFKNLPADFAPPMLTAQYERVAPDPKHWPVLVAKVKRLGLEFRGFTPEQMKSIRSPVLIAQGDRDGVRPEHAAEMFRQIPDAQLAIFPGADHFLLYQDPDRLLGAVTAFLDAPARAK